MNGGKTLKIDASLFVKIHNFQLAQMSQKKRETPDIRRLQKPYKCAIKCNNEPKETHEK